MSPPAPSASQHLKLHLHTVHMSCTVIVLPFIPTATSSPPNGSLSLVSIVVIVPVIFIVVLAVIAVAVGLVCHQRRKIGKLSLSAAHRAPYYTEVATALLVECEALM